jgi:serine/threonine-protein phosphatase 6 regulatory ankyrin repeat subunit B
MSAVGSGKAEQVAKLLAAGAEPDATSSRGLTALMVAAARGHLTVVEVLAAHGADVNQRSCVKQPEHGEVAGVTALMAACDDSTGSPDMIRELVRLGADLNLVDSLGRSALMYAVARGHTAIVRALVDAGARVDTQSDDGLTALDAAREAGEQAALKLLLAASASKDPKGR